MDDKIKQLLQELGTAINDSISSSEDVSRHIQRIRDEGYDLYVVLDATIGLNKQGEEQPEEEAAAVADPSEGKLVPVRPARPAREVQFRIDVNDLSLLRSLGIDPTRKVRSARRVEPLAQASEE